MNICRIYNGSIKPETWVYFNFKTPSQSNERSDDMWPFVPHVLKSI